MVDPKHEYDSVFLNSRRETIVLLIAFAVFFFWSVGVSYAMGYEVDAGDIGKSVLGIPRWVFWGVCVPWLAANAFTFWFAWFFMANDPLGETADGQTVQQQQDGVDS